MDKEINLKTKYLIIGNSAGGVGAAEAIRECDPGGRLLIVSGEPYPAYSRPLISEYLSHERTLDTMLFRPADFYTRNGIELLSGREVLKIDPAGRTATLDDSSTITWQKLLLATGGQPIIPTIKGQDKEGVFSFITLDDAMKIDSYLINVSHAVVIGGGLIGISVTEALSKRGIITTVVEMKERVLNTILDETASTAAARTLSEAGIRLITDDTVSQIEGGTKVEGVTLAGGRHIGCQMVIIAIGVLPRTGLAVDAGLSVKRGISVDRRMATSAPDIYACGDASEGWDFVTGFDRLTPVWPNAYIGGRVAGYNMAGKQAEYLGGTAMNSINYFGIDITSAGLVSAPAEPGYETLVSGKDAAYRKLILRDNVIKGMVFVTDIEKSGLVFGLMRDSINVESFKQSLMSAEFGLADLPHELRRERLGVLTAASHVIPLKETEEQLVAGE
jgi:NAD(P)H-nitrite reductase large subunit